MRRTLLAACAAALLAAVPLSAATVDASFTDPAGDAGDAPDITAIQVSYDSGGNILFHLTLTNFTPEADVAILFDIDRNASTGSSSGMEYQLGLGLSADASESGWWLGQWNGSAWADAPSHSTVRVSANSTYADFRVNKSEIGNPTAFAFAVGSLRYSADAITAADRAPDSSLQTFSYDMTPAATPTPTPTTPPTPKPVVVKPVFGTAKLSVPPVAGKKVVFTLAVKRSDNGAPLTTGAMTCDPSVAGTALGHVESFKGGTAKLAFTIPRTAKGKTLKVKVTIVNAGRAATKIVTYKVR